ncbi:MAG TPA: hypothetical protein PKG73_01325 [bacterium]|nr:hypothetical protein [bacterium]
MIGPVVIFPQAIKVSIILTKKIKNRAYPDKSIDALDEAASSVQLKNISGPNQSRPEVTAKDIRGGYSPMVLSIKNKY